MYRSSQTLPPSFSKLYAMLSAYISSVAPHTYCAVFVAMSNNNTAAAWQRGQRKTSRLETEHTTAHLAWHDEPLLLCISDDALPYPVLDVGVELHGLELGGD